ncbi:unnamed protein product [Moneuplotes crassus]|uniref:Uncharacterized protein n=1 Tax=Euplotes crassus TaxID=5936 RepID=A0AAD2D588_EUPCR|nr:unnamed protein product [Moneuplotes crassus]
MRSIIGGTIGESELADCVILFNGVAFVYMVPLGFCYVVNTLVGNNLEAMDLIFIEIDTYIVLGFSLALRISMVIFRYQIANLFKQDQGIIDIVIADMLLASLIPSVTIPKVQSRQWGFKAMQQCLPCIDSECLLLLCQPRPPSNFIVVSKEPGEYCRSALLLFEYPIFSWFIGQIQLFWLKKFQKGSCKKLRKEVEIGLTFQRV